MTRSQLLKEHVKEEASTLKVSHFQARECAAHDLAIVSWSAFGTVTDAEPKRPRWYRGELVRFLWNPSRADPSQAESDNVRDHFATNASRLAWRKRPGNLAMEYTEPESNALKEAALAGLSATSEKQAESDSETELVEHTAAALFNEPPPTEEDE